MSNHSHVSSNSTNEMFSSLLPHGKKKPFYDSASFGYIVLITLYLILLFTHLGHYAEVSDHILDVIACVAYGLAAVSYMLLLHAHRKHEKELHEHRKQLDDTIHRMSVNQQDSSIGRETTISNKDD